MLPPKGNLRATVLEADGFKLADCQLIHADGVVKPSARQFTKPFISVTPCSFFILPLSALQSTDASVIKK